MAIAVVTGAGAGVGRAAVREFARQGYDVGLIGRDPDRLAAAAADVQGFGMRAVVALADVADAAAVEAAADAMERALGPIDTWVNNAAATVLAPVERMDVADLKRATEVTYLGTVHGTIAALRRMRLREAGTIINIGAALTYRALPLQAAASGAKSAVVGFTEALRTELLHEGSRVKLVMVHLPAMNTPQLDWTLNGTGRRARPIPPVYQPEVAARAIVFAARHPRRDIWVGLSTVLALTFGRIVPGLADRVLGLIGTRAQLTDQRLPAVAGSNLYAPVTGAFAAHGRFDTEARETAWETVTSRHRDAVMAIATVALIAGLRFALRPKQKTSIKRSIAKI